MQRTLLAAFRVVLCVAGPQAFAAEAVDCGPKPDLVPSSSTEGFKADASGKAQLFSKVLPQADVKGNVEAWRSEQHQKYCSLDHQQKDLFFQWVSCQNIMHSTTMSTEEKQKQWGEVLAAFRDQINYKTCARPEFGQIGWQRNETVTQSSGWVGPGSNPDNWCNELINNTIRERGIGPEHDVKVASKNEEQKWGDPILHRNRQYNYHCQITISWDPIYRAKADPLCGTETNTASCVEAH